MEMLKNKAYILLGKISHKFHETHRYENGFISFNE